MRKWVVNGCAYYEEDSDINVGNIEEDIKILNSIIKVNKDFLYDVENQNINQKEIMALEHLLQDYARQKQINEEHQKINGELRTQIKFLEIKLEFKQWGDLDDLRFEEYMNEFIPKQKIKDKFKEIQLLYEKNLKEVNLKEVEKIDKKIFEGICLEAQREFARELLQQEDKNEL